MAKQNKTDDKEQIITRLYIQTDYRTRQDIDSWRAALGLAEDVLFPNRNALLKLYNEIILDAHIQSVIQQRTNRLLGAGYRIVNDAGEEDAEAWKLFESAWFYRFLELALESKWWGFSLIQLWDVNERGYGNVQLIPRAHVVPEFRSVSIMGGLPTDLIAYNQPPYDDYLIEAGEHKDLGLFAKAAVAFIIKKNALLQWSKYTEIFAAPFRVGKTTSRNQKDMERIANNLKRMGSAAYGVFQEGESIEFIESTKGDAYQVYMRLVEMCNAEISKLIVGQTMTTDNGSSRSQGEVHERTAESIAESDKRFIAFLINDVLIPKMINHGFKQVAGKRFEWKAAKDMAQLWKITNELMSHKNVPNDFIEETFGIPVEDKQTTTTNAGIQTDKEEVSLSAGIVRLHADLNTLYRGKHKGCGHD